MSKKTKSVIEETPEDQNPPVDPDPDPDPDPDQERNPSECLILFSSMLETEEFSYTQRHVNLFLSPFQAKKMRRIRDGLATKGVKLMNGKVVTSTSDVIRFMLEQAGDIATVRVVGD